MRRLTWTLSLWLLSVGTFVVTASEVQAQGCGYCEIWDTGWDGYHHALYECDLEEAGWTLCHYDEAIGTCSNGHDWCGGDSSSSLQLR